MERITAREDREVWGSVAGLVVAAQSILQRVEFKGIVHSKTPK